jgi:hypothetical protein
MRDRLQKKMTSTRLHTSFGTDRRCDFSPLFVIVSEAHPVVAADGFAVARHVIAFGGAEHFHKQRLEAGLDLADGIDRPVVALAKGGVGGDQLLDGQV